MKRVVPLALLALAIACGGSESSSNKERPAVEHKAKPPVRVEPPLAPKGASAYEPAALVVWVGTDGIAVSDNLEPAADDPVLVPMTGGRLRNIDFGDKPPLLPELFTELTTRVTAFKEEQSRAGTNQPITAAVVVDRRVDAIALGAVWYSAGAAEVETLKFVFDHGGEPKMVPVTVPDFGIPSRMFEVRQRNSGGSDLTVIDGADRKLISLGEDTCTFTKASSLDAPIAELCKESDNEVDLYLRLSEGATYRDFVALAAHDPRPEGCKGRWQVLATHDSEAPKCLGAVSVADTLRPEFDPDMVAREAGILGIMAQQDASDVSPFGDAFAEDKSGVGGLVGEMVDDDLNVGGLGLAGTGEEPQEPGYVTDAPLARVKTTIVSNDGHLDESLVRRIIRARQVELGRCAGKDGLKKGAKVRLKGKIGSTGKVIFTFVSDDGGYDTAASCMSKALKRWKFPKPSEVNEVVFDVEVREPAQ